MDSEQPKKDSVVMGGHKSIDAASTVLGGLEGILNRWESNSKTQKVDALLDALQYGQEGIKLVAKALNDRNREIRQSASLLLLDTNEDVAKKAVGNLEKFIKRELRLRKM